MNGLLSPARVVRVEGGGKVERNEKRKPLLRIMRNEKCSSIAVTSRKHIVKHRWDRVDSSGGRGIGDLVVSHRILSLLDTDRYNLSLLHTIDTRIDTTRYISA